MNSRDKALMAEVWGVPRSRLPASVRRELPELAERLRKLSRSGDPVAMSCLAYLLTSRRDYKSRLESARLIRRAAALGEPAAQLQLAAVLQRQKKLKAAMVWLERSAKQGMLESVFALGVEKLWGTLSGKTDINRSIELLQEAHRRGHKRAAAMLGWAYDLRAPANPKAAAVWYRIAAAQGDPTAMHNLGAAYENGDGVRRNRRTARKWYALAVQAGLTASRAALSRTRSE